MKVINQTATLHEQTGQSARPDRITCLRRGFGRQVWDKLEDIGYGV